MKIQCKQKSMRITEFSPRKGVKYRKGDIYRDDTEQSHLSEVKVDGKSKEMIVRHPVVDAGSPVVNLICEGTETEFVILKVSQSWMQN